MTEITTQEWACIANKVEPQNKWVIEDGVVCYLSWKQRPVDYYMPIIDDKQQLRLADYLAKKGVAVVYDGWDGHNKFIAIKTIVARCGDTASGEILSSENNINMCRALAVLALIKEQRK